MLMPDPSPKETTRVPVLTIPPEITAHIFTYCLTDFTSAPDIDTAPLLLGRVCSDWRHIAWPSPELWTSLKVDRRDIPVALVETWLSRAQGLPLALELVVPDSEWDGTEVIAVFERYSQTWCEITLDLPVEQLYLFGSDLALPMLERLTIRSEVLPEEGVVLDHPFRNASALRRLTLDRPILLPSLPWAHITSFTSESGDLSPETFLTILQHIPNIVNCSVVIYNQNESDRLPDVAPQLVFLTSLSLESLIPDALDIFDHISVPALRVLNFSSILFSGRVLVQHLQRILSNPDFQLHELSIRIDGDKPKEEDFIQLLEAQPTLEKFELVEGSLDLLIAICRRLSDGSPLLPRLSSLTASPHIYPASEITTTFPVMLDALVDALSARWVADSESFARIQDCGLSWSGQRTDDLDNIVAAFLPRQAELVALGINMAVNT